MKFNQESILKAGVSLMPFIVGGAMMILASCAPSGGVVSNSPSRVAPSSIGAGEATSKARSLGSISPGGGEIAESQSRRSEPRPGLGTGWGDEISSSLSQTSFHRASTKPYGRVATIHYNDREGVEAMAGRWKKSAPAFQKAANGAVEWGVKSGFSTPKHYRGSGRRYVVGKKGRSYSLVVRNLCKSRLEVVLSVDGLDVLDGKPASLKKRGYIVESGETLEVKGFRTSYDAVAAFEFSSVQASYSNLRHEDTRNVGVLGLAVFAEKGHSPWQWSPREIRDRKTASPFADAPQWSPR